MKVTKLMREYAVKNLELLEESTDHDINDAIHRALDLGYLSAAELAEMQADVATTKGNRSTGAPNSKSILAMGLPDHPGNDQAWDALRVRPATHQYSTTKAMGKHAVYGTEVYAWGKPIELPSQAETALLGVWMKHKAAMSGRDVFFDDHERGLLGELFSKQRWCGPVGDVWHESIPGEYVKTLLNDNTSGGQELVPVVFDNAIITFPLLHSEILPLVDLQPVARGRNVESASIDNPTVTWGSAVADGQSLTLFDTSDLVNELNTEIHAVAVAIKIGRDFISDAAVNVGQILEQNIGERMLHELDKVICVGTGNQPQGIMNASGTIDVTSTTPSAGPIVPNDPSNLFFGIAKQYRVPMFNPVYISNDIAYKRIHQLATGVTGDSRYVFGQVLSTYKTFEVPHKICQDLANDQMIFGAMKKYRLYRRMGAQTRYTSEGDTLVRENCDLLYVRGRFGGRVMDANAFAVMTSLPV